MTTNHHNRPRSPGLRSLHDRFIGDDPERVASLDRAVADQAVARWVYDLRTEAGLTREELARRVGVEADTIERLEDADYDGHALSMLRRVADAVGSRMDVRFLPGDEGSRSGD